MFNRRYVEELYLELEKFFKGELLEHLLWRVSIRRILVPQTCGIKVLGSGGCLTRRYTSVTGK